MRGIQSIKKKLVKLFQENFKQFEAGSNPAIVAAGPKSASMAG